MINILYYCIPMANNNRLNAAKNLRKKSNAILELKKKNTKKNTFCNC